MVAVCTGDGKLLGYCLIVCFDGFLLTSLDDYYD